MATWNHVELKRTPAKGRPGNDVTIEFTRDTGEKRTVTFWSLSDTGLAKVITKKKNRFELGWSELNRFDIGNDSKDILRKLIIAIRVTPALTVVQATGWYDSNYPDAVWDGTKLLLKMRNWIEDEFGVTPTWVQFKTYVINNTFEGIDG